MKFSLNISYVNITVLLLIHEYFSIDVNIANRFGYLFVLGTGNTVIEAVKVLIEHGVQPSVIILLSLFSTPHGEFVCFFVCLLVEKGFLCVNSHGCPGTCSVDQAGLEITEIHLPLPCECWD
jgi:hypothetical protein